MAEAAAGRESTQTHFSDLSCGSPGAGTVADEAPSFRAHEATDAGVLSADTSIRSTAELGLQSITDVDVENGSAYAPAGSGLGHAFSDRSYGACLCLVALRCVLASCGSMLIYLAVTFPGRTDEDFLLTRWLVVCRSCESVLKCVLAAHSPLRPHVNADL